MAYLAIDIGASSGRHILGTLENGELHLEEIYRFDNHYANVDGSLCWDIDRLTENVLRGLEECRKLGKIPETVAIDTWGVDYVLLDRSKQVLGQAFSYRDSRTSGIPEAVDEIIPREKLFTHTGLLSIPFNTIYQLYCDRESGRLTQAAHYMALPDYLSYRLTDEIANEYTIATTGGMVSAATGTWDDEIIERLCFPRKLFLPLAEPGTVLGRFSSAVRQRLGFDATVVHAASHDTASAVAACPLDENSAFLSSGTWSVIGQELRQPILDFTAARKSFSNEGGVEHRYVFLKNIMGMWLMQGIRRSVDKKYTYDEMMTMAMASRYDRRIDPNDVRLTAPTDMLTSIRQLLDEPALPLGDALRSVYLSLADSYRTALDTAEQLSGKKISRLIIVGGGTQDAFLNRLTSDVTGRQVTVGPKEATAIGNLLAQIMYSKHIGLTDARKLVNYNLEVLT